MRAIWVKVDPWNKDLVTTALEGGADALLVPEGFSEKVRQLGKITTIAKDGDLVLGRDVVSLQVEKQEDEDAVLEAGKTSRVIVETPDWSVIPLENLIAKGADVVCAVHNIEDAKTAMGVLEHGVWGVLVDTDDPVELGAVISYVREEEPDTSLVTAEIVEVQPLGMGDRVCVDTCTEMGLGEGMLVGNSSSAMFLIHAESIENPYVAPRPFRVNAGAVHAYTRVAGGKTKYLCELAAGDEVLIVNHRGKTSSGIVGRVKIERRPLLLVKARVGEQVITGIMQNAETIRLVAQDGSPRSVVNLAPKDKVMAAVEEGGRHFGHKITERIKEK